MKYLLIGINSKFSHTNLAIRILKTYSGDKNIILREYTINEPEHQVLSQIYKEGADAIFFSCYIWNIEYIKKLCSDLKKITDAKIILGGPEVSFIPETVLMQCDADACIVGEGEVTFSELVRNGLDFKNTDGVVFKDGQEIILNKKRELIDINDVPFPYDDEELQALSGKLIYYETARGCPYNCSYCMSSTIKGVRFRNLETVKKELLIFIKNNVKIVKLTDRTFNADSGRTLEIFKFLIENKRNTTFHFEISAHILNDEIFEVLKKAPKGLFQFEIGVQSTNPETICAINRKTDFEKLSFEVLRIKALGTIHIHLDLIAGLPFETFEIFKKSFNDVFSLRPDMLQLGFLKLLYGTKIRAEEKEYSYLYSDFPPYEVLGNKFISYNEILKLKNIEEIVDKFYNSGSFEESIEFLLRKYETPFLLFSDLADYFEEKGLFLFSHSRNSLFEILVDFAKEKNFEEVFYDLLKLDFLKAGNNKSPEWSLESFDEDFYKSRFSLIEENPDVFKEFDGKPMKDIIKQVHFEKFSYDVLRDMKKKENILVFFKDGTVKKL